MRHLPSLLLAVVLVAAASPAGAKERPLRVAVNNEFRPLSWVEDGPKLAGFNVDIAEALCARLKRTCEMRAVGIGDRVPGLMLKRFDVLVTPLSENEPWAHAVALTAPYIRTGSVFLARAGSGAALDARDLAGKTIAVKENAPHAVYVETRFGDRVALEESYNWRHALDALADGKADLAFVPIFPAVHFLHGDSGKGYGIVGAPVTEGSFGGKLHIAVRKEDAALHDALDAALAEIVADGTWKTIAARYFPDAVLGAIAPSGAPASKAAR